MAAASLSYPIVTAKRPFHFVLEKGSNNKISLCSYFISENTYSVQNYQCQKGKNLSNTSLFCSQLCWKIRQVIWPCWKCAAQSSTADKILHTKLHKNRCVRLVLTRANYPAEKVGIFLLAEVNICHNDVKISTLIANKNTSWIRAIWRR